MDNLRRLDATEPAAAWRALCERLTALGGELTGTSFTGGPVDEAEGYRHLARQLSTALRAELEHADPEHPSFHRYEEPWSQWGGPNPDNVYVRAAIDATATYRVWGNVTGVRDAIFSIVEGDMHLDRYGVYAECTLGEMEVGTGGDFELTVGPANDAGGNCLITDPQATLLLIRQFQCDWEHDRVATFHIERVDRRGEPVPRPEPATVAIALERAIEWTERSLRYWSAYGAQAAAALPVNAFGPPRTPPGGAPHIAYGAGRWSLADDEALLIAVDEPDADYWGWTIHTDRWFDSGDFSSRQTSLNMTQTHVDPDGRVRVVATGHDPGTANWIDTGGRAEGLLLYRYVGARTRPVPDAKVVPVASIVEHVPADHPRVDAAQRREQLARRSVAVLARYV
jgi:hypothetical protein